MIDLNNHIKNNQLKLLVKPNSSKNKIIKWDANKEALIITIKAQPEKGKANKELIRFLTKLLKKKITIKSGCTSKEKIVNIN